MNRSTNQLIDDLRVALPSWTSQRRQASGLEPLVLAADDLAVWRRSQARTVLGAEHVLSLIDKGAAPVVLMKGLEVAQLYPNELDRHFRDVDVLVPDPRSVWEEFVALGYTRRPHRRVDLDHHHLPSLTAPFGEIGVEVHLRPNTPGWAEVPLPLIFETAQPSRTGIEGLLRPRDDVHALVMALHAWKGGFTRVRDLFDAILMASVSAVPVEHTARQLGLTSMWRWTVRFANWKLFGEGTLATRTAVWALLPRHPGVVDRRRTRLLAPYIAANPIRVTRGHLAEYRLGQEARRRSPLTEST